MDRLSTCPSEFFPDESAQPSATDLNWQTPWEREKKRLYEPIFQSVIGDLLQKKYAADELADHLPGRIMDFVPKNINPDFAHKSERMAEEIRQEFIGQFPHAP